MRKFYLECDGVRVGLNGENGVFCDTPTGLGVSYTSTTTRISDGFYTVSERYPNVGQYVCNINILGATPYATYKTLADTIFGADTLRLIYKPEATEYYADASLLSLTKTELTTGRLLTCPLTLNLTSLWYTDTTMTGTGSISVPVGGQVDTAIVLTTTGVALTNPTFTITDVGGSVATIALTYSTAASDTIQYSNLWNDCHIYATVNGTVTDIVNYVNTSNTVYGRTKKAFTVACSNANAPLNLKVRRYWRTV